MPPTFTRKLENHIAKTAAVMAGSVKPGQFFIASQDGNVYLFVKSKTPALAVVIGCFYDGILTNNEIKVGSERIVYRDTPCFIVGVDFFLGEECFGRFD